MIEAPMELSAQTHARLPGRVTRWGFFVVALVLGTALLVSSITSYVGARALLETVIWAQADGISRRFDRLMRERRGYPSVEDLDEFLTDYAADGVRHIALFDREGGLLMDAGSSDDIRMVEPGELRVVGDQVQAGFGPPRDRESKPGGFGGRLLPPPGGPMKAGPPGRPGPPGPPGHLALGPLDLGSRGPPVLVIELLPEAALALRARTVRDLLVGVAVAIALMLAAAIFWRLSRRAQAVEAHLSRQRHLAALGEMSAVLAHEIRNPLAALKGHAQLLAERVQGDATLERKTARIVDASQRLETLTHSLLDFARIGTVELEPVDPTALLRRCADACPVTVEIDDTDAPAAWALDETRIGQVLSNLLDNAVQAAPESSVQARIRRGGSRLVFEVRDQGPGVPPEEREQIFEPFHTKRTRGTGLGLAVTRRIVELHRGQIEITDAPGGGACFRVSLPGDPEA